MRIVFGWNSFTLKSRTPAEAGLPNTDEKISAFELRQKYFHIFYIPLFPIGQQWAARKDGKLYNVASLLETHLNLQPVSKRTPWYTFTGPILIIAGLLIYGISEKVTAMQGVRQAKQDYENKVAVLRDEIAKTDMHDYYWLVDNGPAQSFVLLKVDSIQGGDITFSLLRTDTPGQQMTPMTMQSLFMTEGAAAEKITLSKQKLESSFPGNFKDEGKGSDLLNDGHRYELHEIRHLDGPILVDRGTGNWNGRDLTIEIVNIGWTGTLTKITNVSGSFKWVTPLPAVIETAMVSYAHGNGIFQLHGVNETAYPTYKAELIMVDSSQKEHKYVLQGEGNMKSLVQVY